MKSESQDSVRKLFNLPSDEKIFDDFGCSIIDGISYHGRIYLTENYICFDSNILGFKSKCVINFQEIKEIKRGSTNTIDIILLNPDKKKAKYTFGSFTNPNMAYKRIKMICKAYLSKINQNNLDKSSSNINLNESKSFSIILSDSEKTEEEEEEEKNTGMKTRSLSRTGSTSINLNELGKSVKQNVQPNNEIEKEQLNNQEAQEDVQFTPIDENVMYQAAKVVINLSPEEFMNKYLGKVRETNTEGLFDYLGDRFDINITEWTKNEKDPNENSKIDKYTRTQNFSLRLTGVPFVNQSQVSKTQVYTYNPSGSPKYIITGSCSSIGVPYSTYFTIEDTLELYPYMGGSKCILRAFATNVFTKSTIFKSTIISTTKKEFQKEIDKWIGFMKFKGEKIENYQPPVKYKKIVPDKATYKLAHGIEKEKNDNDQNNAYSKVFNIFNEILQKKNLIIIIMLGIIIIGLFIVLISQNRQMRLLNKNIVEIKALLAQMTSNNINKDNVIHGYKEIKTEL